jgi:hypothetical protein
MKVCIVRLEHGRSIFNVSHVYALHYDMWLSTAAALHRSPIVPRINLWYPALQFSFVRGGRKGNRLIFHVITPGLAIAQPALPLPNVSIREPTCPKSALKTWPFEQVHPVKIFSLANKTQLILTLLWFCKIGKTVWEMAGWTSEFPFSAKWCLQIWILSSFLLVPLIGDWQP